MRILIIILAVLFTGHLATAQKITKLYGYWNVQVPGNIPIVPNDWSKKEATVDEHNESYFIYIESSQARAPVIESVSIKGRKYKATAIKQEQLPVYFQYYDGIGQKKISLVPKGRKNVYIIVPGETIGTVPYKRGSNELLVEYKNGNKNSSCGLKKMKQLPSPVVP